MINKEIPPSNGRLFLEGITGDELIEKLAERLKPELQAIALSSAPDELLTCKQVQEMLGICHQTRINWTNQGLLKSYSLGGRKIYYKQSEVVNALTPIE